MTPFAPGSVGRREQWGLGEALPLQAGPGGFVQSPPAQPGPSPAGAETLWTAKLPEWQVMVRPDWKSEHDRDTNLAPTPGPRGFDPSPLYVVFVVSFVSGHRRNPTPVSKCRLNANFFKIII